MSPRRIEPPGAGGFVRILAGHYPPGVKLRVETVQSVKGGRPGDFRVYELEKQNQSVGWEFGHPIAMPKIIAGF